MMARILRIFRSESRVTFCEVQLRALLLHLFFGGVGAQCGQSGFEGCLTTNAISDHCLYSSVVERQSCKLKVLGSIPSGGCLIQTWDFISHDDHASDL